MKKQILSAACAAILGAVIAPNAIAESFDGKPVNLKWEIWNGVASAGNVLATVEETTVTNSVTGFHTTAGTNGDSGDTGAPNDYQLWDINLKGEMVTLTFTSRAKFDDANHQYMYTGPEGFHFSDTAGNLADIVAVHVDDTIAPDSFEKSLVTFDANNIYVDLNGSMCHWSGMASMPDCANANSPTGLNNVIQLHVQFADSGSGSGMMKIDSLFNWLEGQYPSLLPSHVESEMVAGYHARFYPATGLYIGAKDGNLFSFGTAGTLPGMTSYGSLNAFYGMAGL